MTEVNGMGNIERGLACEYCGGRGSHPPVDGQDSEYRCDGCEGTGYEIGALAAAYEGAVGENERLRAGITVLLNDLRQVDGDGVTIVVRWRERLRELIGGR